MTVQEDDHQQALILLSGAGTVPKDTQESNIDACVQGSLTANIEKAAANLRGNEASLAKKILGEDGFLGAPAESVKASAACVASIRSTLGRPLKPTDPEEWMKAALWGGSDTSADLTVIMGIISAAADILNHDELQDAVWQGLLGRSMTTTAVTTFEMHRVAREVCKGFGQQLRYRYPPDTYANKWGLRKNVKAVNVEQALTELIKGTKVYIIPSNLESTGFFVRLAAEGFAPCVEANVFRFVPATCTLVVDQTHHERWKATRLRSVFDDEMFSYGSHYPGHRYIAKNFAMMAANASKIGLSDEFDFDNWDGPGSDGNLDL